MLVLLCQNLVKLSVISHSKEIGELRLPIFNLEVFLYLFDFQNKLKKLNENLYVITDRTLILNDVKCYPVLLKFGNRTRRSSNTAGYHYLDSDAQKYMEMKQSGQAGEYMGGIGEFVPEYDRFNLADGTILLRGWRSFVLHLVNKKACTLKQARKVFNCPGLGESSWDKMSSEDKLAWAKKVENA